MKKPMITLMLLTICIVLASCSSPSSSTVVPEDIPQSSEADADADSISTKQEDYGQSVMTYQEYLAAQEDSRVTVDCYVQAKEGWHDGFCSVYAQNADGAYYLARLYCSENEYEDLVPGRLIRATGYKSHWADSLEISDASFVLLDGSWISEPADMTALIGTDELIRHQNEKVCFHGMKIETMPDGHSVWYIGWDNSGEEDQNAELYFKASANGTGCSFTVKPSLCENAEKVIEILQQLQVGDTVDLEGYLRFYNGMLPRITEIIPMNGNLTDQP
ncbi:MAG: hypothetical protein IKS55_01455 [Oscillospiraceae bacterium]|nr:hypothetical protein [Oscillospiraceae bacterium]